MSTKLRIMWLTAVPLALFAVFALGCSPAADNGGGGDDTVSDGTTDDDGPMSDDGAGGDADSAPAATDDGAPSGAAVEWATLKGRFVYDGEAPTPAKIDVTKDVDFCGKHMLVNEELLVNSENGGIKNVIVFLDVRRGDDQPPIAPSYEESAAAEVLLDNKNCRFEPHICLLRTTQSFIIGNDDPVGHNTKIDCFDNQSINPSVPANSKEDAYKNHFTAEENLPANVSCSIHPWMSARLVVRENPYMAVSDENGDFEIKDLPAGKWTMQVYQEKSGFVDSVNVGGKDENWNKGRVEIDTSKGDIDWGDVKVKPVVFE
ncbi:MAG: methylamine utilization protein [Pirellulaceae bacterium]